MDIEDEDLESFIANRRSGPKPFSQAKGSEYPEHLFDTPESQRHTPQVNDNQHTTWSLCQVRAVRSATADDTHSYSNGDQRRSPSMIGEIEPLIDFDNTGGHSDCGWRMQTPTLGLAEGCESPLFVRQEEDVRPPARSRSPRLFSRLIPIEYDSDSNESEAVVPGGRLQTVRLVSSNGHNHATRNVTMRDAFAKADYVKKIRQNPYTSGIFAYDETSDTRTRAERIKAQHALRLSARTQSHVSSAGRNTTMEPTRRIGHTSDKISLSTQHRQSSNVASKRKRLNSTNGRDMLTGVSSTGLIQQQHGLRNGGVHDSAALTTGESLTPLDRSSGSQDDAKREVLEYVRCQYQIYGGALAKLGESCKKNEKYWKDMEAQIQPEYDAFANKLAGVGITDVNNLKGALIDWDLDIGVRALMQKQLMYSKLLQDALQ